MKFLTKYVFRIRRIFYVPILILILLSYTMAFISDDFDVEYVYGVLPGFVVYTDLEKIGMPENCLGTVKAMFIFIDDEVRSDTSILEHELIHLKQFYRTFGTSQFLYVFNRNLLLKHEAEAYSLMIEHERDIPLLAKLIKDEYSNGNAELKMIENYIKKYRKNI